MRIVTVEERILTPAFSAATRSLPSSPPAKLRAHMELALLDLGESRISAMDEAGITVQVLSLVVNGLDYLPLADAGALAVDANDRIAAAIAAYPGRFAGFATLALTDPTAAILEMRRAREQLGFVGFLFPCGLKDLFLDDERFAPVWAEAETLDAPVYLYPAPFPRRVEQAYYSGLPKNMGKLLSIAAWDWHAETGLHVLRLIMSGLFDRHPRLRIVVGHMGENLPSSIDRAAGALEMMTHHLHRPVSEYFHRHFWVTTSGYFTTTMFRSALEVVGIDRVLFSIEYPFSSTQRGRAFLDSLKLAEESLAKLSHANADALFGFTFPETSLGGKA